jgi:hypothetical protein
MTAILELRENKISFQTQLHEASHLEQSKEIGENCSPFCICSCCHFLTVYQFKSLSVTEEAIASVIVRPNFTYKNPYTKDFKTSIWQPPKFNSID